MAIFMKIEGSNIQGDVSAKGHEKWIRLEGVEFGVNRALHTQPGRVVDREGTHPSISEVSVSKRFDQTSPLIFQEATTGKGKLTVSIDFCTTGEQVTPYAQYVLHNVIISGYNVSSAEVTEQSGQNNDTTQTTTHAYPLERIKFNMDKIEVSATPFDANHQPGASVRSGYDLRQATAA